MLILNVIQGPDKGRRFELPDTEPQMVGRSSEALPLSDPAISRRHAELTPDDGKWLINDLKSANGTYVNGVRITRSTTLHPGDQIRTGATLFIFGQEPRDPAEQQVRMMRPGMMDSSVDKSVPSNDDSVILAVPEPSADAARQLKIIYELVRLVGSSFDRKALMGRVMDLIFQHFDADRGCILLRDEQGSRLRPVVARYRTEPEDGQPHEKIHVSRTIVRHVLQHNEGVLSSNAMTDKRFASGESVQAYGIHSAICVPIKFRDRVSGVIYVDSQVANYSYTEDQLRLMIAIGVQTGVALANADLYQRGLLNARLAAVGETVASLSHSIKNILQGMRGGAEVVELGIRKGEMNIVSNGWDILSRNLERIYELTMNMLAYSKQRQPEIDMIDLRSVLREATELIGPQCDRQHVALITEFDEHLPPIPADAGGLHQAVMNLLNNAMDAVEPDTGAITLRAQYDAAADEAVITISDNGPGIDAEQRERIFQPFHSTKGQRGTGLGLAVTQKIVAEHGGKIDVSSEPGKGATFTIRLSTRASKDPSETAASAAANAKAT